MEFCDVLWKEKLKMSLWHLPMHPEDVTVSLLCCPLDINLESMVSKKDKIVEVFCKNQVLV